jgi:hypothetical protein
MKVYVLMGYDWGDYTNGYQGSDFIKGIFSNEENAIKHMNKKEDDIIEFELDTYKNNIE